MSCQQVPTTPALNPYPRSVQVGEFEVAIDGGIWVAIRGQKRLHVHVTLEVLNALPKVDVERTTVDGVISVFRESSTEFPRPGLTSGSAAVRGIPKVFECGAGLDRLDEPSRPPPLAGPGVAGSVAVRY